MWFQFIDFLYLINMKEGHTRTISIHFGKGYHLLDQRKHFDDFRTPSVV